MKDLGEVSLVIGIESFQGQSKRQLGLSQNFILEKFWKDLICMISHLVSCLFSKEKISVKDRAHKITEQCKMKDI